MPTTTDPYTPDPQIPVPEPAPLPAGNEMKRTQPLDEIETACKKVKLDSAPNLPSTPAMPSTESSQGQAKTEKQIQKEVERVEREKRKEADRLAKEKEKIEKQAAKELKRKQAMELKQEREAKKEEERKRKEEERAKKQAKRDELERERVEKKRKAEEERAAKEAEREKRELEREKKEAERKQAELEREMAEQAKERAQSKISSFFQVGRKVSSSSPAPTTTTGTSNDLPADSNTNASTQDDYERDFLPFFLLTSTILAPLTHTSDPMYLEKGMSELDAIISQEPMESSDLTMFFQENAYNFTNEVTYTSPELIVEALDSSSTTELVMVNLLKRLSPIKHISFYENSKPPYVGTWCSAEHQRIHIPASDPLNTSLTGFDYAYDSDLEWNKEEEDGEDVDNDEDDDEDDLMMEDDDIDDFVENNLEGNATRKFHSLVVVKKWNDGSNDDFFTLFSCSVLVPDTKLPIDPFANCAKTSDKSLQSHNTDTAIVTGDKTQANSVSPIKPRLLTAHKKVIVDAAIVKRLIAFVEENHDFTVGTLVELSQKEFKDYTKAVLKNTIQDIAAYDKKTQKWAITEDAKLKFLQ